MIAITNFYSRALGKRIYCFALIGLFALTAQWIMSKHTHDHAEIHFNVYLN